MTNPTHKHSDCKGTFKPCGLDRDNGNVLCVFMCSDCKAAVEYPAEMVEPPDRTDPPKWPPTGTIRVSVDW